MAHFPNIAIVSDTSNRPQNGIGNCFGHYWLRSGSGCSGIMELGHADHFIHGFSGPIPESLCDGNVGLGQDCCFHKNFCRSRVAINICFGLSQSFQKP